MKHLTLLCDLTIRPATTDTIGHQPPHRVGTIGIDDQGILLRIERVPHRCNRPVDGATHPFEALAGGQCTSRTVGPLQLIDNQAFKDSFLWMPGYFLALITAIGLYSARLLKKKEA